MKDRGKFFETLVKLIQESFRDNPKTKIYQRHSLTSKSGRRKNFDVIIETEANSYPIYIAIECKDHKRKTEAKEIDAFDNKCKTVEVISKKIFVSKNGYQPGAVEDAQEFS